MTEATLTKIKPTDRDPQDYAIRQRGGNETDQTCDFSFEGNTHDGPARKS